MGSKIWPTLATLQKHREAAAYYSLQLNPCWPKIPKMGPRSQCHRIDAGRFLLCLFLHPNAFKKHQKTSFFPGKNDGFDEVPQRQFSPAACSPFNPWLRSSCSRRDDPTDSSESTCGVVESPWTKLVNWHLFWHNIVQFVMPVRMTNTCLKPCPIHFPFLCVWTKTTNSMKSLAILVKASPQKPQICRTQACLPPRPTKPWVISSKCALSKGLIIETQLFGCRFVEQYESQISTSSHLVRMENKGMLKPTNE